MMNHRGYLSEMLLWRFGSGKTFVWLCLNLVYMDIYMAPVRAFAFAVGIKATPYFLPFLLSDVYYLSIFMLSVLYFFSDVPFLGRRQMYIIIRMGRERWNTYNCIYILIAGFMIWLAAFGLNVLLLGGQVRFAPEWGKVIGTLAMTDAGVQTQQMIALPYGTIANYEPIEFLMLSWLLSGLAISAVGMCMYCISLFAGRICSAVAGSVLVILPGIAAYLFATPLNYVSPVSWMRIGVFKSGQIMRMPTMQYMIIVLIALLGIFVMVCNWKVKRMDFEWSEEG